MKIDLRNSLSRRALLKTGLLTMATTVVPPGVAETKPTSNDSQERKTSPLLNSQSSYSKPIVETLSGKVRGYISNGISTFKGIPYGASTGGLRRFMPPAKPDPWTGVRSCLTYGNACIPIFPFISDGARGGLGDEDGFLLYRIAGFQGYSEDCLRLNVWTPETDNQKRPVMVYMHGGGFAAGCGNDLLSYDGENLARRHDVVVVTHNHRLNLFGFLNLAEFGDKYANSGNIGMLDQLAVLEWVRDNIANFGGDPGNVTIFGQSGGGGKVSALMAMPAAKGLFHKAIVQSGSMGGLRALDEKLAAAVLQELGISPDRADEIQKVAPDRLVEATASAIMKGPAGKMGLTGLMSSFWPVTDGRVIPVGSWDKEAPSISANVPLIVGTNLNEFANGVDNPDAGFDEMELISRLRKRYGDKATEVAAAYRDEHPRETPFGIWAAISASEVRRAAIEQARRKAALNAAPAYHYVYCWRTPALDGKPGTFHSAEIAMVFDNAELCVNYSCNSREGNAVAASMSGAWTAFARHGDPNHSGIPAWPAYREQTKSTMLFNEPPTVKQDFEGKGLRILADFPAPAIS